MAVSADRRPAPVVGLLAANRQKMNPGRGVRPSGVQLSKWRLKW